MRGVRLIATGEVDQPTRVTLEPSTSAAEPIGRRRVHTGDGAHDAPVYDGETLRPGPPIEGPAIVQYPFTTLVLRPGDSANVLASGDILVTIR